MEELYKNTKIYVLLLGSLNLELKSNPDVYTFQGS